MKGITAAAIASIEGALSRCHQLCHLHRGVILGAESYSGRKNTQVFRRYDTVSAPHRKASTRMRVIAFVLAVLLDWLEECSAFGHAFGGARPGSVTTGCARATIARMLDVVVSPDGPAAEPVKEKLPDYMKSKRRMYPRKCDVMDQIEYFVQEKIDDGLLLNKEKAWQPSDFLPDSQKPTEEWFDEVREIREAHAEVPDEVPRRVHIGSAWWGHITPPRPAGTARALGGCSPLPGGAERSSRSARDDRRPCLREPDP